MLQDIRYAFRILRQNRAFAIVAILSLALGIGSNTAIFTLVDAVILRSLPVQKPEELVVIARNPETPSPSFNYPDYEYVRDHNQSYSGVVAAGGSGSPVGFSVPAEGARGSELAVCALVTGNYFEVLGVRAIAGRVFTPADNEAEGASPYAIVSYDFWRRRFGGEPSAIGRSILINNSPFTVIGVTQAGFTGTTVGSSPEVYVPIKMLRQVNRFVRQWNNRHYWWLTVLARRKAGVSLESANAEAGVLLEQIRVNDPERRPAPSYDKEAEKRDRGVAIPGAGGYSGFRNSVEKPLTILTVVVGLVLLIACANVANLLLVRAAARQREIAVRLAVGAGRGRLIGQLILETLVVATLGGLAGMAFAWWGVKVLLSLMPQRLVPLTVDVTPDWRILGFAFGVSLLTGLVCGVLPAIAASRPNLVSALKNETAAARRRFDVRKGLVATQVAIALLLMIGAGLFVRSLRNLRTLDPGFLRENVLMVSVDPGRGGGYKGQRLRDYYERLLERTLRLPEVRAASTAALTPLQGSRWNSGISFEGYQWKAAEKPYVDMNAVSPRYFETLGIPILMGRDFRVEDNPPFTQDPPEKAPREEKMGPPAPVAIVNEIVAKHFFPNQNPIGRRFTMGDKFKIENSFEIVGVVKDVKYFGLRKDPESMIYVPNWRLGADSVSLCIRTVGNPERVITAIRREAAALDPSIPVQQTLTLEQQYENNISQERIVTTLCGFFGGLALLLAAIGLYGVMAHSVARRVREIGIRMALGAQRAEILRLVLRETLLMIGIGTVIGLPAAFATTRLVSTLLFGLSPQDPWSIAASTAALLFITALAGYIPARRATRVDPMVALRYE